MLTYEVDFYLDVKNYEHKSQSVVKLGIVELKICQFKWIEYFLVENIQSETKTEANTRKK